MAHGNDDRRYSASEQRRNERQKPYMNIVFGDQEKHNDTTSEKRI